jgi:hypothetical protein
MNEEQKAIVRKIKTLVKQLDATIQAEIDDYVTNNY